MKMKHYDGEERILSFTAAPAGWSVVWMTEDAEDNCWTDPMPGWLTIENFTVYDDEVNSSVVVVPTYSGYNGEIEPVSQVRFSTAHVFQIIGPGEDETKYHGGMQKELEQIKAWRAKQSATVERRGRK